MIEIIKFKLLLRKYKNVFSDILSDMILTEFKQNNIIFIDGNGNKMICQINDSNIIFKMDTKRKIMVILPDKDAKGDLKVVDIIKEERPNGCIIEEIEKYYDYTIKSSNERVLVDLISKRYVIDVNIQVDDEDKFDQLSKMKTIFESHMKTLIKPNGSLKWCTDSPYSTITMIDGKDISNIYDVVNGDDKIYRIYDLYNGKINERNSHDILGINLGLLRVDAFAYKEKSGITFKEDKICGKSSDFNQNNEFIYDLIYNKIGYPKVVDLCDINSIIDAITYKKTVVQSVKEALEKELGMPYEIFDKFDCDKQHKLLKK